MEEKIGVAGLAYVLIRYRGILYTLDHYKRYANPAMGIRKNHKTIKMTHSPTTKLPDCWYGTTKCLTFVKIKPFFVVNELECLLVSSSEITVGGIL